MQHETPSKPPVITIPQAGKIYFGIGRSASYEAARRGEIPTIKIGRKHLVPIAAMDRVLAGAADKVLRIATPGIAEATM